MQESDGVSLEMQQERIAAWCLGNGYELSSVFVETQSGGRADNRPQLAKAVAKACKTKGILVVFSLSRFSRSVRDTLEMSERLDRAGANLASLSERLDTSSAVGRMVFQMLSTLAEYERSCLAERTKAAMGYLRRKNRRISGKIPYGYELAEGGVNLNLCPIEQETVYRIEEMRSAGSTLAAIASALNTDDIPTREGKRWFPMTVKYVLDRQAKIAA